MFNKTSHKMATYLLGKNIISENEHEIIVYGLNYIMQTFTYMTLFVVLGAILGGFWSAIGITIGFFMIRTTCGGIHSNSELGCFILSATIFGASLYIVNVYEGHYLYHLFFWFISISTLVLGPIDHENKPFYEGQKEILTGKSRVAIAALTLIYILYVFVELNIAKGMLLGAFSAAGSLLIAHKKRREILT